MTEPSRSFLSQQMPWRLQSAEMAGVCCAQRARARSLSGSSLCSSGSLRALLPCSFARASICFKRPFTVQTMCSICTVSISGLDWYWIVLIPTFGGLVVWPDPAPFHRRRAGAIGCGRDRGAALQDGRVETPRGLGVGAGLDDHAGYGRLVGARRAGRASGRGHFNWVSRRINARRNHRARPAGLCGGGGGLGQSSTPRSRGRFSRSKWCCAISRSTPLRRSSSPVWRARSSTGWNSAVSPNSRCPRPACCNSTWSCPPSSCWV